MSVQIITYTKRLGLCIIIILFHAHKRIVCLGFYSLLLLSFLFSFLFSGHLVKRQNVHQFQCCHRDPALPASQSKSLRQVAWLPHDRYCFRSTGHASSDMCQQNYYSGASLAIDYSIFFSKMEQYNKHGTLPLKLTILLNLPLHMFPMHRKGQ